MAAMRQRICATHGGVGPPPAEAAPQGATAKCNDGTYSISKTKADTCSDHNGVDRWLDQ